MYIYNLLSFLVYMYICICIYVCICICICIINICTYTYIIYTYTYIIHILNSKKWVYKKKIIKKVPKNSKNSKIIKKGPKVHEGRLGLRIWARKMGKTNHRFVSDLDLGCGVPVKISARSDGRIKSYTPFCAACAGPYCIRIQYQNPLAPLP